MTIQSDREWCVRACRWLPAIAGVAALLSLVPEALSPGPYFYDQNYCLQAAVRLAHGQGLTGCSDHEPPPLDVATPVYSRLYWWAPGYSVMVAGLLRLGVPLPLAASLIKIVAYIGGWVAGAALARRGVPDGNWLLLFLMAVLPFARIVPLYSQSDVLVWAIIPLWMLAAMNIWSRMRDSARLRDVAVPVCTLGLLTAAAIMFRWASMFLAPAAVVCIVLGAYHYRRPWLLPTLATLALALGPYKLVLLSNAAATGHSGSQGDDIIGAHAWSLRGLLTDEPLLGLLGRPSGVYDLLASVSSSVARHGSDLLAIPLLAAMAWALVRVLRRTPGGLEPRPGLWVAVAVAYGTMCAMLLAATPGARLLVDSGAYGIFEPRYYTLLSLPALLLAVQLVACAQRRGAALQRRWRLVAAACACVLVASGLWAAKSQFGGLVKLPFRYGIAPLQVRQAPERVVVDREIARQSAKRVMLFAERANRFLPEDTIPAYFPPSLERIPSLHASRPTLLFVVLDTAPAEETRRHARCYPPSVEIIRRFHLHEVSDQSLTDTGVYCGVVAPRLEPVPGETRDAVP